MAKRKTSRRTPRKKPAPRGAWRLGPRRLIARLALSVALALCLAVGIYAIVRPPTTPYILSEGVRLGGVERQWMPMERIAPVLARSVVAAEDAGYCQHWGFDMGAIRDAIAAGASRGGSTISQQTVKNLWLWQDRSWVRKALEGVMTPLAETMWSKRRMLELYLNVAEFGDGVFGAEAAARHHFDKAAADLSAREAALLAAVLPNPKERIASRPTQFVERRARSIADGAATIQADGRAACFED